MAFYYVGCTVSSHWKVWYSYPWGSGLESSFGGKMFLISRAYYCCSPKKIFEQSLQSGTNTVSCWSQIVAPFRCSRAETYAVEKVLLNDSSALGRQVKGTCSIKCGLLTPYSIRSSRFHSRSRPHLPSWPHHCQI